MINVYVIGGGIFYESLVVLVVVYICGGNCFLNLVVIVLIFGIEIDIVVGLWKMDV